MIFKEIHIGQLIKKTVNERNLELNRIANFFKLKEYEIEEMYEYEDVSTDMLLKWSKVLEYDFFRIYSQHLILYSPIRAIDSSQNKDSVSPPSFRKNIYSKEVIDFILDLILTGKKTKQEVIDEYRIPKTTLYKWISKYSNGTEYIKK